jgi:hypothetical protein
MRNCWITYNKVAWLEGWKMGHLFKLRVFALEMLIGLLLGALGFWQLVLKQPLIKFSDNVELMEKFAAAVMTIGGTVLLSGIFRFAFSVRLDNTEQRILDSLRLGRHEVVKTISNFQPKGHNPRPGDECLAYKYIYWRTKDDTGTPMWLCFSPLEWNTRVLPFLDAYGVIDKEPFRENHRYYLAMVQLQRSLAISATRITLGDTPEGEMAGVYVFSIPVGLPTRLYGFLRHVNMAGDQSLSSCVLSKTPIAIDQLDDIWLAGGGRAKVDRNFPAGDAVGSKVVAA